MKRLFAGAMSETLLLQLLSLRHTGRLLDLRRPRTFTEKVQWRKLRDRKPIYTALTDKIAAKRLIAAQFGAERVVPSLWEGTALDLAVLEALPLPFVVKSNNSSGEIAFVASAADFASAAAAAKSWMATRRPRHNVEWAYYDIEPKLLIEPFLRDAGGEPPPDFKFHVFGGRAELIQVDMDRRRAHRRAIYNRHWERLPLTLTIGGPLERDPIPRPATLGQMIEFAEHVARTFVPDYLRVDLYEHEGRVLLGEATVYPGSGFETFDPVNWDAKLGALWTLPEPHP